MEKFLDKVVDIYVKNLSIDGDQQVILKYSLRLIISSVLGFGAAFFLALMLNMEYEVLIILITSSIIKVFAGGAHCSNMRNCIIYGAVVMNIFAALGRLISLEPLETLVFLLISFVIGLLTIIEYAPADSPGKPIASQRKRSKLRTLSITVLSIWLTSMTLIFVISKEWSIVIYFSSLGILWSSISLSKLGYNLCRLGDSLLNRVFN